MMIADLVDQDDFRERLAGLGVPVSAGQAPKDCVREALRWRDAQNELVQQQLDTLFSELLKHADLVLPEVKNAIEEALG